MNRAFRRIHENCIFTEYCNYGTVRKGFSCPFVNNYNLSSFLAGKATRFVLLAIILWDSLISSVGLSNWLLNILFMSSIELFERAKSGEKNIKLYIYADEIFIVQRTLFILYLPA